MPLLRLLPLSPLPKATRIPGHMALLRCTILPRLILIPPVTLILRLPLRLRNPTLLARILMPQKPTLPRQLRRPVELILIQNIAKTLLSNIITFRPWEQFHSFIGYCCYCKLTGKWLSFISRVCNLLVQLVTPTGHTRHIDLVFVSCFTACERAMYFLSRASV